MEEQLVSKKIAERLPVSLAAKSATLAALEEGWTRPPESSSLLKIYYFFYRKQFIQLNELV